MGDLFLEPNDVVATSEADGRIVIRFTTPQARNPISSNVLYCLEKFISVLEAGHPVNDVVFTGSGDAFASGADLKELSELKGEAARIVATGGQTVMNRIASLSVSTTAVINGFCYGGGMDLALACKTRIASSSATFCHPGARLGIMTGWGGTQRLPRLIGEAFALEMFFTASPIDAERALEMGLIDSIDDKAIADLVGQ